MMFPFTLGMLIARTFKPHKIKGAFWWCSLILIVSFSVPYIASSGNPSINSLYEFLCIALIFPAVVWMGACGNSENHITGRINKFLGDLSYPLYIVHYPIMYIFYKWLIEKHLYTFGQTWWISLTVIAASILLAFICLKLYDVPVRRFLAKKC